MRTRTAAIVIVALTAAALLYTALLYSSLPDRIPIHWGPSGQVDGWGEKRWAVFFGPAGLASMLVLLYVLPWLSPRNFQVESFRDTYNYIVVVVALLLEFVHVVSLQAGLHPDADMGKTLIAGILLFFALLGNVMGKVRRNFWMGVRTPWTLASDTVWIRTHRLAARLYVAAGLLGALAVWLGAPLAWVFVTFIAVVLVPVPYSLILYKRLEREGRLDPGGPAAHEQAG